jgi:hypothetical protein
MAGGIMVDTHPPITAVRITAGMPRRTTVIDIDECTARPTLTTVDHATMVAGTTDGIGTTIATGDIAERNHSRSSKLTVKRRDARGSSIKSKLRFQNELDTATQLAPQNNQLMSKHRVPRSQPQAASST